jgi:DNA polymerase III subunit delta
MAAPASVVLFWGDDEFLLRSAALELLEERGLRATEVDASEWQGGETSDLATPSLWGEERGLLVSGAHALPDAGQREVLAYVAAPVPEALLVLTMVSRAKQGPPLAKKVAAAGGTVKHVALARKDLPGWIAGRAKARGARLAGAAPAALVATVGEDTAALDQAVEQLAAAFPGRPIGPEEVRAQFVGLGEQRVWDLCDHALAGRLPQAMVTLRGLLEAREEPLFILGGIASRVRDLLRVRDLPDGLPSAQAARATGVRFDWQVRRYREQAARFALEDLIRLLERVTEADRALKGGVPGDVLLPALVAAMAGEPDAALDIPIRVSR